MLRPNGQTWIAHKSDEIRGRGRDISPFVVCAHRRLGKSYFPLVVMLEECLRTPGVRCVYGGPTQDQTREIVDGNLKRILLTCPDDIRFWPRGLSWYFWNPAWGVNENHASVLKLAGVEHRRGDRLRGQACDVACLDECREMPYLRYLVEDVLGPQFIGRENPFLILLTTPPATSDHPWVQHYRPRALEDDRYIEIKGSENPDFTEADKKMLRRLYGDENSIAWRREVECEVVADPDELIVPEFQEERQHIVIPAWRRGSALIDGRTKEPWKLPEHYFPYVVMDSGFDPDFTAILWMYVDFRGQLLYVIDEVFRRRMTLSDIAKAVRQGNHRNWGPNPPRRVQHIADIEKRALADLAQHPYKLYFMPVRKERYSKEAGHSNLRSLLRARRIRVLGTCRRLLDQLENGLWARDRMGQLKQDYLRTETNGHWDAGKALVYGATMINFHANPIPKQGSFGGGKVPYCGTTSCGGILTRALGRRPNRRL